MDRLSPQSLLVSSEKRETPMTLPKTLFDDGIVHCSLEDNAGGTSGLLCWSPSCTATQISFPPARHTQPHPTI